MKKYTIFLICICSIGLAIGLVVKTSFTSLDLLDEELISDYQVSYVMTKESVKTKDEYPDGPIVIEEYGLTMIDQYYIDAVKESLEASDVILVCKITSDADYLVESLQQHAVVKQVIRGDQYYIGKEIKIITEAGRVNIPLKIFAGVNNIMKKDIEYLVFLNNVESKYFDSKKELLFTLNNEMAISYFCLSDNIETKIVEPNSEFLIPYKEVKDYEFFVGDEYWLNEILDLKEEMIHTYLGE